MAVLSTTRCPEQGMVYWVKVIRETKSKKLSRMPYWDWNTLSNLYHSTL